MAFSHAARPGRTGSKSFFVPTSTMAAVGDICPEGKIHTVDPKFAS
jgi:hypothetical protein